MGIPIPGKDGLYIETGPRWVNSSLCSSMLLLVHYGHPVSDMLCCEYSVKGNYYSQLLFTSQYQLFINCACKINRWIQCNNVSFLNLHDITGQLWRGHHYSDVIMGAMAFQITSLTIVYSSVSSGAYQRYKKYIQENIKALRHWPSCGEFIGDQWIPHTNGQ